MDCVDLKKLPSFLLWRQGNCVKADRTAKKGRLGVLPPCAHIRTEDPMVQSPTDNGRQAVLQAPAQLFMKWGQPVHLLETCVRKPSVPVTSVWSLPLASNLPPCLLFLPVCLCVCYNTQTVCLWHVINTPQLISLGLGIAYQLTHPAMSYIWRDGALENYQSLCHKKM